jgi:hypothetical protein
MQRLFSTFPSRGPGIALLVWRLCLGGMLVQDASAGPVAGWWQAGALVCAAALGLGLLTPLSALAAAFLESLALVDDLRFITALSGLYGLAIALVGPGAYSLDSRLFARRVLVWRSRRRDDARE